MRWVRLSLSPNLILRIDGGIASGAPPKALI